MCLGPSPLSTPCRVSGWSVVPLSVPYTFSVLIQDISNALTTSFSIHRSPFELAPIPPTPPPPCPPCPPIQDPWDNIIQTYRYTMSVSLDRPNVRMVKDAPYPYSITWDSGPASKHLTLRARQNFYKETSVLTRQPGTILQLPWSDGEVFYLIAQSANVNASSDEQRAVFSQAEEAYLEGHVPNEMPKGKFHTDVLRTEAAEYSNYGYYYTCLTVQASAFALYKFYHPCLPSFATKGNALDVALSIIGFSTEVWRYNGLSADD